MPLAALPDAALASLIRDRRVAVVLTAATSAQLVAGLAGLGGWPCPLKSLTGLPCPGCGLTRGVMALLHGEWRESLAAHAFAPLLLLGAAAVAVAALLPARRREAFADAVERAERRARVSVLLPAALLLYWSVRLLFLPGLFGR
ncbi:MAG TPA: DUF2752 domain-containing protein [Pyrinomonadaceae bacterium]|jgi:hypothetical protein